MLPAARIEPHHNRHHYDDQWARSNWVGRWERGQRPRRNLDGEFRSGVVLDDATTNTTEQMDPRRILQGHDGSEREARA
jgi:hypothetical protein